MSTSIKSLSHGMDRSYENAIKIINSRRRVQRPKVESRVGDANFPGRTSGMAQSSVRGVPSLHGMKSWLERMGHSASTINDLNVIHVAGTKGKGSTCAFVDAFLSAYAGRTGGLPRKVGFYSSPHLVYPEGRIRIASQPITRPLFARYFFEVADALALLGDDAGANGMATEAEPKPRYLQLFLLTALHAFVREGVDAAIIETHHGGEFDATNVVEAPLVTVVTSIGMDHVAELGPRLENIAWHKAGIFKRGADAFTIPQDEAVAAVFRERAAEKGVRLQTVDPYQVDSSFVIDVQPRVQKLNASLALAATRRFLAKLWPDGPSLQHEDVSDGLARFSWPGRFQRLSQGNVHWYLDSAHNEMSVPQSAEWFADMLKKQRVPSNVPCILIFSHISERRDPVAVFRELVQSLRSVRIDRLILTVYEQYLSLDAQPLNIEVDVRQYTDIWQSVRPEGAVSYEPDVARAIELARGMADGQDGVHALITGSGYLVGHALRHLAPDGYA